ncbi:MAG TPA: hypothetical protein VFA31_03585 [Candidatus Polarisedimenticolia bacterium]|nr:hypothetical protein [Candidatus Polarisedimenticolia bacterium]
MNRRFRPYRLASLFPVLLIGLVTLVGGWLNGVDMSGHVVDDFSSDPIGTAGPAKITHGERSVTADPSSGTFVFPNLPRESKVSVDAPGYLRTSVPVTQEEIRMSPLSFTIQVNEAGKPDKHIASADIRQGTTSLGTTNDGGNTVISPYPGKDAKFLICAKDYDQKEVTIHGVTGTFELTPGTNACPPLPTPTPSPSPSASPSASPGASPSASPSPTASP